MTHPRDEPRASDALLSTAVAGPDNTGGPIVMDPDAPEPGDTTRPGYSPGGHYVGPSANGVVLGCTGVLVVIGVVIGFFVALMTYAYSAMCSDDFDTSDCGSAQAAALVPLGAVVAGVVMWGIGCSRRRSPSGLWWVIAGTVLALAPTLFFLLLATGSI